MTATVSLPPDIFDIDNFSASLRDNSSETLQICKSAQQSVQDYLDALFVSGSDIRELIATRSSFIDAILIALWKNLDWHQNAMQELALIAVGGYGRSELFPHSDIDLLILINDSADSEQYHSHVQKFLTTLWDVGLNVGHSVRTVSDCKNKAAEDLTIITNLIESRHMHGCKNTYQELMRAVSSGNMWSSMEFFTAKSEEQKNRHERFTNQEYNLEPNVKNSPGGLRDLQTLGWIAKRHFDIGGRFDIKNTEFLSDDEFSLLEKGQLFLWKTRYALHMISGREEDRLLFDHQRHIAKTFGYEDDDEKLAIEKFMQAYYRWVSTLGGLNELLIQNFDEAIIRACEPRKVLQINPRFRIRNGYLEACSNTVFTKSPSALLEVFVLLSRYEDVKGVRASTIRLIRDHRDLIDENFRQDPQNQQLFMTVFRSSGNVPLQLQRLVRYGILGRYLPEFKDIIGQMQHDLFHVYTVDAHTLEVLKNMWHFLQEGATDEYPVAARVTKRLPKIELLYIAGLYHDIGKGRGGDHSQLGAIDAENFCIRHGFNKQDTNLVCWLVKHHLEMSSIAQRKDISDPDIIHDFAKFVGDKKYLDYLYALTVADINATNPTLWNSWRASLLRQLYADTMRALRRGLENPVDKTERILDIQNQCIEYLENQGFAEEEIRHFWIDAGEDYFIREKTEDIIWHTTSRSLHLNPDEPLISVKQSSHSDFEAATQIFVHTKNQGYIFAVLAASMEQLDLSIQDARIYQSQADYTMDTFFVLDANGQAIGNDPGRIEHIKNELTKQLSDPTQFPDIVQRRTPRQMRFFSTPTQTNMFTDTIQNCTVLEVITPDRPGLLARIGRIFVAFDIVLLNAKITTLGERVEDVFFIADNSRQPIQDIDCCEAIQTAIKQELDEQSTNNSLF